jgi:hypothetical protein
MRTLLIFWLCLVHMSQRQRKLRTQRKNFKHHHATPNPRFTQEENIVLAAVDKALASSNNSATIGKNGEIPLLRFLRDYLPNTLKTTTGHFLTPSGVISPQIDIMILDARYPLLAHNEDGSVLAMLHSVIATVEVKTNLSTRDIPKMWSNAIEIMHLSEEISDKDDIEETWFISTEVVAYRAKQSLDTIEDKFFAFAEPQKAGLDTYILRLANIDEGLDQQVGAFLYLEPPFPEDKPNEPETIDGYWPSTALLHTPLNDFYYRLVQSSYYMLTWRDFTLGDIGEHIMSYMSWSTVKYKEDGE